MTAKSPRPLSAYRALLLALLLMLPLLSACSSEAGTADEQTIAPGEYLVIPLSEVSQTARFYPVSVNGTTMEIIAVKDANGNVRTAFNTCQICYGSGRGYYRQQQDVLVCQNCGNRFTVDQIEVEAGGCNPYPIFSGDKTVTEDSIQISYDFLEASRHIFAQWKTSY